MNDNKFSKMKVHWRAYSHCHFSNMPHLPYSQKESNNGQTNTIEKKTHEKQMSSG